MKLIYFLLTVFILQINSAAFAQSITYAGKNVPLKAIFSAIQKQTGFGFFYDQKLLSKAKPVSLNVKNAALADVLAAIFKSQNLGYSIENNTILVSQKTVPSNLKSKKKTNNAIKQSQQKPTPIITAAANKQENAGVTKTDEKHSIQPDTLANVVNTKPGEPSKKATTSGNPGLQADPGNSANKAQPPASTKAFDTENKSSEGLFKHLLPSVRLNKINLGFKGGVNSSRINATELDGSRSGYIGTELYGGFFADTRISEKLHLGTELTFSFTDSYHFLEVPIHLKYNISERWNVMAGPKFDYIVDRADEYDYYKRVGLSAEIGSQYRINSLFFAEARYGYGFTRQINSPGFGFYNGTRNTFRVGMGINFDRREETGKVAKDLGPMRLRAGLSTGFALTSGYDVTVGADLRIQKDLGSASIGMFTVGYNHYSLKSGFIETNLAYFPIKTGMKFFPGGGFYLAPEVGMAIGTKSEVYTYPFVYAAGIGKEIGKSFDLSLRYEKLTGRIVDYLDEIKRPAQIALRLEYGFNLNPGKHGPGAFGSPKAAPAATGTRKKSIFLELGGNGILAANFDMRFKPDRNDGWGFRIGGGTVTKYITLPLGLNYIIGGRRHGFEAGIGITPVYNLTNDGVNIVGYGMRGESPKVQTMSLLTAGYRLQSYNGFMFRANTSITHSRRYFSFVWPGLSVGYSFK